MSSYGQEILASYLTALTGKVPQLDVHPKWLEPLELDLFWPDWDLAIEFQGQGHHAPVFGRANFAKQQAADRRKMNLCEQHGILLVRFNLVDLRHPQAADVIMHRFTQAYGQAAGTARFFRICGENPFSRTALFNFNSRFDTYRLNQIAEYSHSRVGNAKERRALKRAMHRRMT